MTQKVHDLIIEKSQIEERIKQLKTFLYSKDFLDLFDTIEQSMVEMQISSMEAYYFAILARINYLKDFKTSDN